MSESISPTICQFMKFSKFSTSHITKIGWIYLHILYSVWVDSSFILHIFRNTCHCHALTCIDFSLWGINSWKNLILFLQSKLSFQIKHHATEKFISLSSYQIIVHERFFNESLIGSVSFERSIKIIHPNGL